MTDYDDLPNPVEFAAQVVSRAGSMTYHGKTHQITVRLQSHNFIAVQGMAEASGLTRSDMINRVIEAGAFAIREQMSDEAEDALKVHLDRVTGELYEELKGDQKK